MSFITKYNRDEKVHEAEKLQKGSKTETVGYVPANVRITQLLAAGKNLAESRKDAYDFDADKVDLTMELEDVTRKRGIDLVDVMNARDKVLTRIRQKRTDRINKLKEEQKKRQKELLMEEINKEIKAKTEPV